MRSRSLVIVSEAKQSRTLIGVVEIAAVASLPRNDTKLLLLFDLRRD